MTPAEAGSEVPVRQSFDLWGLVNRRKWFIITGVLLGLIGGGAYYLVAPPVYETFAQIIVYRQDPTLLTDRPGARPTTGQFEILPKEVLSTEILRLRSVEVVRDAVVQSQLDRLKSFEGEPLIVSEIIENLSVSKGGEGITQDANVVNIGFRCSDAGDCSQVVNAIIDSYKRSVGSDFESQGTKLLSLIGEAKSELSEKLKKLDAAYREFRQRAPTVWLGDDRTSQESYRERLLAIEKARAECELKITDLATQLKTITDASAKGENRDALMLMVERLAGISEYKAGRQMALLQENYFPLIAKRDNLTQLYGPDHPLVEGVNKQIDAFREMFKSELRANEKDDKGGELLTYYLESLKTELAKYQAQQAILDAKSKSEMEAAKKLLEFELQDKAMRDEMARTRDLYVAVVQQVDEINLVKGMGGYITQVITPPSIGTQVAPSLPVSLLAGAVVGFMLFFGIGYLIDWSDKSFRSAEEIRGNLGLPVIGHIPIILTDSEEEPQAGSGRLAPVLASFHLPNSKYAEAYRSVRTALYFSTSGERHKVIQITSPSKGDGKSTLAANLAISIAQSGKRVLIVDADFRRPRQAELFGLKDQIGLSSVIQQEAEIPDAVQSTPLANLSVLVSGSKPVNPAELLTSSRFKELLDTLRESYDFVILDTPPTLAVTDASVVAAWSDAVLLAVQITHNSRPNTILATERLQAIGANLIGVVVNGVGWKRSMAYRYTGTFGSGSRHYRLGTDFLSLDPAHYIYGERPMKPPSPDLHEEAPAETVDAGEPTR